MKKQPTMNDVAKLAGVTQPTVSYVINNTANVSDEVRERVNRAIEELDYKPNYFARGLKTKRSNMVGVVIPDILNEYYASMVHEIEKHLLKEDYSIVIHSTGYDAELEERAMDSLADYNVAAVIVAYQPVGAKSRALLEQADRPVVVLEGGTVCGGIPSINTDNYYGGHTVADYLLDRGCKRLVYVGQNSEIEALAERRRGFLAAVDERGGDATCQVVETSGPDNKWDEGVKLGRQLLQYDLDGVAVSADIVAVGILKSLLSTGKRVPEDIAVVGYDDVPVARLFVPALTTMAQPLKDMCSLAVFKVLQAINGEPIFDALLKPQLIIRETA